MKIFTICLFILVTLAFGAYARTSSDIHSDAFFKQLQSGDSNALQQFRQDAMHTPWLAHYTAAIGLF